MATEYLLFYAVDIRRTLSLIFPQVQEALRKTGFFKGPGQLLGLNHLGYSPCARI